MQNDEVANVFDFRFDFLVELVDLGLLDCLGRKKLDQPNDAVLNQVNAGRFQRLEKTAGQPRATQFLFHCFSRLPVLNLMTLGRSADRPSRLSSKVFLRFIIGHVFTAKDQAIADPVLQWNPPLPAAAAGGRAGIGSGWRDRFALHRDRAVAV